jgi:predicted nucleic acid-binding protein
MSAILIDTNVLVYAHDRGEHRKQGQAIEILAALHTTGNGRLSVQCLGEFFSATTRGQNPKLSTTQAYQQVAYFSRTFQVYDLTAMIVQEAARGVGAYSFSYFDAQIWATAHLNQVPVILSEDFASDSVVEGVRFVNPFTPDFSLQDWV